MRNETNAQDAAVDGLRLPSSAKPEPALNQRRLEAVIDDAANANGVNADEVDDHDDGNAIVIGMMSTTTPGATTTTVPGTVITIMMTNTTTMLNTGMLINALAPPVGAPRRLQP